MYLIIKIFYKRKISMDTCKAKGFRNLENIILYNFHSKSLRVDIKCMSVEG